MIFVWKAFPKSLNGSRLIPPLGFSRFPPDRTRDTCANLGKNQSGIRADVMLPKAEEEGSADDDFFPSTNQRRIRCRDVATCFHGLQTVSNEVERPWAHRVVPSKRLPRPPRHWRGGAPGNCVSWEHRPFPDNNDANLGESQTSSLG